MMKCWKRLWCTSIATGQKSLVWTRSSATSVKIQFKTIKSILLLENFQLKTINKINKKNFLKKRQKKKKILRQRERESESESERIKQNKILNNLPSGICARPVFPDVHNPTDMMLDRWIIAVASFTFPWSSRIEGRFIFNDSEESRNGSSSSADNSTTRSSSCLLTFTFSFLLSLNNRRL